MARTNSTPISGVTASGGLIVPATPTDIADIKLLASAYGANGALTIFIYAIASSTLPIASLAPKIFGTVSTNRAMKAGWML